MCVYCNLARIYASELKQLEDLSGKTTNYLHVVGGGSNVSLLNQLTANFIGKEVIAGPGEVTAIGNILVQMISVGEFENLSQALHWLASSSSFECYRPQI